MLKEFKNALKKKVRVSERPSNFVVNFTMPNPDAYEADDPLCGLTKDLDFRPTIPCRSTHGLVNQRGSQLAFGGSMSILVPANATADGPDGDVFPEYG